MLMSVAIIVGAAGLVRGDTPKYAATWPSAVLHDGEAEGKTMFGAEQRWISPDGEPVLFVHVVRGDGKGVLRAVHRDNGSDVAQDVLVHDFGKDELVVIARDDGAIGFQFHSYRTHPNKYLGVRAVWKNHQVAITKKQAFTGYQPTPVWLFYLRQARAGLGVALTARRRAQQRQHERIQPLVRRRVRRAHTRRADDGPAGQAARRRPGEGRAADARQPRLLRRQELLPRRHLRGRRVAARAERMLRDDHGGLRRCEDERTARALYRHRKRVTPVADHLALDPTRLPAHSAPSV